MHQHLYWQKLRYNISFAEELHIENKEFLDSI